MLTEWIVLAEDGIRDAWVCWCRNRPSDYGFYPCDAEGNDMEPEGDWPGLYRCDRCGRVIEPETGKVVGRT